jgi:hypothetical protein
MSLIRSVLLSIITSYFYIGLAIKFSIYIYCDHRFPSFCRLDLQEAGKLSSKIYKPLKAIKNILKVNFIPKIDLRQSSTNIFPKSKQIFSNNVNKLTMITDKAPLVNQSSVDRDK